MDTIVAHWPQSQSLVEWVRALSPFFGLALIAHAVYRQTDKPKKPTTKLSIEGPIEVLDPKNALGKCRRTYRLNLVNNSPKKLTDVRVKQRHLVNRYGEPSQNDGKSFKLIDDPYAQSFVISPEDHKQIDIMLLDETKDGNTADILYVNPSTKVTIPQHFFPHVLVVRATANEMDKPVDKTFTLFVDRNGILKMIEGKIGP